MATTNSKHTNTTMWFVVSIVYISVRSKHVFIWLMHSTDPRLPPQLQTSPLDNNCYCSFLFVVFVFVFVFFVLSLELWRCSSDIFLSSRPRTGLVTTYILGMAEARSVNVKKTTTITTTSPSHSKTKVHAWAYFEVRKASTIQEHYNMQNTCSCIAAF